MRKARLGILLVGLASLLFWTSGCTSLAYRQRMARLRERLKDVHSRKKKFTYDELDDATLERLLQDLRHKKKAIRIEAIRTLGFFAHPKAVSPLIEALQNRRNDDEVKREIIIALGEIGDDRAVKPLAVALNNYSERSLRRLLRITMEVISGMGGKGKIELVEMMWSGRSMVRVAAAEALDKIGWRPCEIAEQVGYLIARGEYRKIARIGAPAVECLVQVLRKKEKPKRSLAAGALSRMGSQAVIPLIGVLHEEDVDVRQRATATLGKIGHTRAMEALYLVLQDDDREVRRLAADALGKIGIVWNIEPLSLALQDEDRRVREAAVKALGKIDNDEVIEPLIQALKDNDTRVRIAAALALCKKGDTRAIKPLREMLKDKEKDVRASAKEALKIINKQK